MDKNVFTQSDYKAYLGLVLGPGSRAKAAVVLGCQPAYLSRVLNADAHLSLEQADAMSQFLGHDADESRGFLLLVQIARAGTESLRRQFTEQLRELTQKKLTLKTKLQGQESLSPEDQHRFYSHWYFSALHALISVPTLQTKVALAARLRLPLAVISEALEFLESRGLAVRDGERYSTGPRHLHLSKESPYVGAYHTLWRLRAVNSIEVPRANDMHYTLALSISEADALLLKSRILNFIDEQLKMIAKSKEETALGLNIDLFEL